MRLNATIFGAWLVAVFFVSYGITSFVNDRAWETISSTISNALPVQTFPQWITIVGEGSDLIYDLNSIKSLSNGTKQVNTYLPNLKVTYISYVSCPSWRFTVTGDTEWRIIPPGTKVETLAYKVCGKN